MQCIHVGSSCFNSTAWEIQRSQWKIESRIHSPLNFFKLRHVTKDYRIVDMNATSKQWTHENVTLIWPSWEKGFGDVMGMTLLPLSKVIQDEALGNMLWAFSGIGNSNLANIVRSRLADKTCAFERPPANWTQCKFCAKYTRVCLSTLPTSTVPQPRTFFEFWMPPPSPIPSIYDNKIVLIPRHSKHRGIHWHLTKELCGEKCVIMNTSRDLMEQRTELQNACAIVYAWGGNWVQTLFSTNAHIVEVQSDIFRKHSGQWGEQPYRWNGCTRREVACSRYVTKSKCKSLSCAWKENMHLKPRDFMNFMKDRTDCVTNAHIGTR